jgi:hypothetical protein
LWFATLYWWIIDSARLKSISSQRSYSETSRACCGTPGAPHILCYCWVVGCSCTIGVVALRRPKWLRRFISLMCSLSSEGVVACELFADLVGLQCRQTYALAADRIRRQDILEERNSSATAVHRAAASVS